MKNYQKLGLVVVFATGLFSLNLSFTNNNVIKSLELSNVKALTETEVVGEVGGGETVTCEPTTKNVCKITSSGGIVLEGVGQPRAVSN